MAPFILRSLLKYVSAYSYTPINTGETVVKINYGSTNGIPGSTDQPTSNNPIAKLPPVRDSPIRWASLILYLGVTTPLIFAMIVMVAAGTINT